MHNLTQDVGSRPLQVCKGPQMPTSLNRRLMKKFWRSMFKKDDQTKLFAKVLSLNDDGRQIEDLYILHNKGMPKRGT